MLGEARAVHRTPPTLVGRVPRRRRGLACRRKLFLMWPLMTRFYRRLPELDGYSDEECQRLVWQAKIRREDAMWILPLCAGAAALLVWAGIAGSVAVLLASLWPATMSGPADAKIAVALGFGALIVWMAWVGTARLLILRSIRAMLNRAGCPYCDFSLIGLKVKAGYVTCPECGSRVGLHEINLTAEDLAVKGRGGGVPPPVSPLARPGERADAAPPPRWYGRLRPGVRPSPEGGQVQKEARQGRAGGAGGAEGGAGGADR